MVNAKALLLLLFRNITLMMAYDLLSEIAAIGVVRLILLLQLIILVECIYEIIITRRG